MSGAGSIGAKTPEEKNHIVATIKWKLRLVENEFKTGTNLRQGVHARYAQLRQKAEMFTVRIVDNFVFIFHHKFY